jgi:hypothetical protein
MNMILGQVLHIGAVILLACLPLEIAPKMILGLAVVSCAPGIFYAARYKSNRAILALPYSFFYMSYLSWTRLYALISPHKTEWMTRKLNAPQVPEHGFDTEAFSLEEIKDRLRKAA